MEENLSTQKKKYIKVKSVSYAYGGELKLKKRICDGFYSSNWIYMFDSEFICTTRWFRNIFLVCIYGHSNLHSRQQR